MAAYRELIGSVGAIRQEDLFVILGKVQDVFGCIPKVVVADLAARSGVPETRIWGALTAYPGFTVANED